MRPTLMANNSAQKAELGVSLHFTVNSFYSVANAELLYEALSDYRDTHLKLAFEHIQHEDYKSAHTYFNSYEDLNQMLKELTLGLIDLANTNYNAADSANYTSATLARIGQDRKADKADRFDRWKETYVGQLDKEEEAESAPSTKEELTASISTLMDEHDAPQERQHLTELMEGMPEHDLAILHGLAEKGFTPTQLSDVAYRLSK